MHCRRARSCRARVVEQAAAKSHLGCWLAALVLVSWAGQALSAAIGADAGQEPWIVMFKPGVDGQQLWEQLCPTVSIGANPELAGAGPPLALPFDSSIPAQMASGMVLNCSAFFGSLLNGFAGHFTQKQLAQLKCSYKQSIDYVVSDRLMTIDSPVFSTSAAAGGVPASRRMLPEQMEAPWGLDMLDQFQPLDSTYHYTFNGSGVNVYVLDTGVRASHSEFLDPGSNATRVLHGFDAVSTNNSTNDCHGHGTHVAAVIGGNTYGVAKNVTIHAVRVLGCDGSAMLSSLLKGLEWVAKHHVKPAVVHMSIEGGFSSVVNKAVDRLLKTHHVHVVVSSGNSGKDACRSSPASTPGAVTVAAVDTTIARWAYANWGSCVDVFAPGVSILSAVASSNTASALKTGTSMAAPFVSGVVAAYLETRPGASPDEVQQRLYRSAVRGVVQDDTRGFATMFPSVQQSLQDISSTPNRLLQSNLTTQALISPGQLFVDSNTTMLEVTVALSQRPAAPVAVAVSVPPAWDGNPLTDVFPSQLLFEPDAWNVSQTLALHPKPVCDGDYYLSLDFTSAASAGGVDDGFPALHTVLVRDGRRRSGDTADMARVINSLPFSDQADSSSFGDDYGCQVTDAAPDVVYSFTPPVAMDVTISTCGSGYDTKLLLAKALADPASYLCNDDDRGCAANTACSKLDVSLEANTTYFIVVDGYAGAAGEYVLSVRCPKCDPPSPDFAAAEDDSAGGVSKASLITALLQLSTTPLAAGGGSNGGGAISKAAEEAAAAAAVAELAGAGGAAWDEALGARRRRQLMGTGEGLQPQPQPSAGGGGSGGSGVSGAVWSAMARVGDGSVRLLRISLWDSLVAAMLGQGGTGWPWPAAGVNGSASAGLLAPQGSTTQPVRVSAWAAEPAAASSPSAAVVAAPAASSAASASAASGLPGFGPQACVSAGWGGGGGTGGGGTVGFCTPQPQPQQQTKAAAPAEADEGKPSADGGQQGVCRGDDDGSGRALLGRCGVQPPQLPASADGAAG